jgi:hypothetical protein
VAKHELLPFEVEQALSRLFTRELKLAKEAEKFKQELEACYDFDPACLYSQIDDTNYGYIDTKNLKRFFNKTSIATSKKLLICAIRRFDLDADSRLNKQEFQEGIKT